jgi:SAM-dependent MidA family methyltransferase
LPDPAAELQELSRRLTRRIRAGLPRDGFLPFGEYMERVLYEPGLGYYSAGSHKFGAAGDFVTAPELGTVFARSLALQCEELAARLGADSWDVLEVGAGSGALAEGLLKALGRSAAPPRRYRILERSADLRAQQQRRLAALPLPSGLSVEWLDRPPTNSWQGILLANEILDALPAERFHWDGRDLVQAGVVWREDRFAWATRPATAEFVATVRRTLGERLADLPPGYTSEIRPHLDAWLRAVTSALKRGMALFVDYGYPRAEYYHPQRRDGTLVCHYRHRAHGDPFWWPGLQDLSVFVDFTSVAQAGRACGLELVGYATQGSFLAALGLESLAGPLANLPEQERWALAREIRELVLPGAMGEKFQVMALARDWPEPADQKPLLGFRGPGLAHRL